MGMDAYEIRYACLEMAERIVTNHGNYATGTNTITDIIETAEKLREFISRKDGKPRDPTREEANFQALSGILPDESTTLHLKPKGIRKGIHQVREDHAELPESFVPPVSPVGESVARAYDPAQRMDPHKVAAIMEGAERKVPNASARE